ncbi:hypothetical protein JX265_002510 [Neoarthrinium moseri]|uniref:Rhodopsin domain-containing protein n=1 Tax=Neoarthrinium moseri TaxID=1658444 RepID=A0A9P9WUM5_9PEZI|nr:uncharacterized protein JN550_000324 [Neoarthrinium moseri]KAI1854871.1 hypothetical protein JX266_000989 [Neoarthrinium moseri]KAI1878142.1 hypothetical protein JN550_000324 [Neoarthrinium moseri]KAI1879556.1 hypothetical protein JX265_002510 [Neoarthrinium moseri]
MMNFRDGEMVPNRNFTSEFLTDPVNYPPSPQQSVAIAITIAFPAAALVVVVTRIAGRLSSRQFGWDDGLVCIAMVFSILETAASYMYIKTNFIGISLRNIPPHDPTPGAIWNYAIQILYNPILALVKTSILLFLLRLFGQKPGVRRFIIWLNTANILNMFAIFFAIVFQCFPIEKIWDPTRPGSCVDRRVLFVTSSSINILTDLLVLGLPLRIFLDLKIPRRTKIALMVVFLLGFTVTIVGIIRLALLIQGLFMLIELPDPTANIGFVTSAIETNLFLITASAPALRPLLRAWFPKVFGLGRDEVEGATERRVIGTTAATQLQTRLTRMKSSRTALRSQSPTPSEDDLVMSYNGIMRRSDIIVRYDPRLTSRDGEGGDGRIEKWV